MLFFLSVFGVSEYLDNVEGLYYENETKTKLTRAPTGTKTVTVQPGVVSIAREFAKDAKTSLEEVNFLEGALESIEDFAFTSVSKLQVINLTLCKNLVVIGSSAFSICQGIKGIFFPLDGKLNKIGVSSFDWTRIVNFSIKIPSSVTEISNSAFRSCQFKEIIFDGDSLCQKIGTYAFESAKITSLMIPKYLKNMSAASFSENYNLNIINVHYKNNFYAALNNVLYDANLTTVIFVPIALRGKIIIREGVTTIGTQAFRSSKAEFVFFPSTLEKIEMYCFQSSSITEAILPDTLHTIEDGALRYTNLISFVVPKSLSVLNSGVFLNCRKLCNITFHNNFTTIGSECFSGCTALTNIEFSSSITHIYSKSFHSCTGLTTITLPSNLVYIGDAAFNGSINLILVILPQSIETIGGGLFENCHPNLVVRFDEVGQFEADEYYILYADNKTRVIQQFAVPSNLNIILPESVVTIENGAFASSKIASIEFGSNVTELKYRSFAQCKSLTSLTLSDSIRTLGNEVFSGTSIRTIELSKHIKILPYRLFYSCSNLQSIIIPSYVNEIGTECFAQCSSLSNIELMDGVQKIMGKAFYGCVSMYSMLIPGSIEVLFNGAFEGSNIHILNFDENISMNEISEGAFKNCVTLESIDFGNSITSIGKSSFEGCTSLKNISVNTNIISIKEKAFSGCTSVSQIEIIGRTNLQEIHESAFEGLNGLQKVFVSNESDSYTTSEDNSVWYSKNIDKIIKYCCANQKSEFIIPNTVLEISGCAFEGALFLQKVVIGERIEIIGFRAFAGCKNLTLLEIPNKVHTVGNLAFDGCNMSCGSVKYPPRLYYQLMKAGLSKESLQKCITNQFSVLSSFRPINPELLMLITNED